MGKHINWCYGIQLWTHLLSGPINITIKKKVSAAFTDIIVPKKIIGELHPNWTRNKRNHIPIK